MSLERSNFDFGDDYVESALRAGHFAIFLDGLDELAPDLRRGMTSDIQQFAQRYEKNWIFISSRPDYELEGWSDFTLMRVEPLSVEQAQKLIELLPFDEQVKSKFIRELRGGLFEDHRSFLSNPLLLSIMLLTYGQVAHIPKKLNVFYNQAYEALFQRHDALKGGFQRERRTGLDIQDFERVFSLYCLQGYDKKRVDLSQMEALDYIEKAKEILGLELDNRDFLLDALQAVCILIQDGLLISFSHRSFQEYFAARFIARAGADVQEGLIRKYALDANRDNVLRLLYEINPEAVEDQFLLPGFKELRRRIGHAERIRSPQYLRYLKSWCREISFVGDSFSATIRAQERFVEWMLFVLRNCSEMAGGDSSEVLGNYALDEIAEKYKTDESPLVIDVGSLEIGDPLVRDLSRLEGVLGIESLRTVVRIGQRISAKRESSRASLEQLLSPSKD